MKDWKIHLKQRLRNTVKRAYHSEFLIPYPVKRSWRENWLDPLLRRLTSQRQQKESNVSTDHQRQQEANLLLSDNAKRELSWFLSHPDARMQIGSHDSKYHEPLVSMVLVVFNKAELSYACLRSLEQLHYKNTELIIVDNASTDQTEALLSRVEGNVRILRQRENLHFLRGCNIAFENLHPQSRYVLLVNNDAFLNSFAIHQALSVFERWPNTGIVGGQVLHLDGRLQEAGNVIFSDGACSGIGRRQSPWQPLAQVRRRVDYVSGCLLMIETNLLKGLGGFDIDFAPAYYEETDLCIRSWQAGRPVIYEPSCRLYHVEFASSPKGKDQASELMQNNRTKLEKKHHKWLQLQPSRLEHQDLSSIHTCLRSNAYPSRILWVDDRNPDSSFGAGYGRMQDLITTLADLGCFITIFATHQTPDCSLHAVSGDYELQWGSLRELQLLLQNRSNFYSHICTSRQHNHRLLIDCLDDIANNSTTHPRPKLIGDVESLFSIREYGKSFVKEHDKISTPDLQELLELPGLKQELNNLRQFDAFLTVSEREASLLMRHLNKPVAIAGHAFKQPERNKITPYYKRKGLLFMGAMNHPDIPNIDSLHWLAREILPELRNQNRIDPREARLTVVGPYRADLVTPLIDRIANIWPVDHSGQVDDIDKVLQNQRLLLAPTRYAAGLAHKVHHSISRGLPVVTTKLICDQMGWQSGDGLLCSNDPKEIAQKIGQLYNDQFLWEQVQTAGLTKIEEECDPQKLRNALHKIFL